MTRRSPAVRIVALATLSLALEACSPVYVFKSWRGHHDVMSRRRPIEEALRDPNTPPELAAKLRLADEARSFAVDVMGMPKTKNYAEFVQLDRPYVTYAVTACPKTSLQPYEWWFPFVGRVPYKGFFRKEDAVREAAALDRRGFDTLIGGISAYSTLGWFRDPLLSTMLDASAGRIAETLIHEMTHGMIYYRDNGDFNESVATFVGQRGALDFLRRRFGPGSAEAREWTKELEGGSKDDGAWNETYNELEALYGSSATEAEKVIRREAVFAGARERHHVAKINNAVVRAHLRYHEDLGDFLRAHKTLGADWRRTLPFFKSLDRRGPRETLRKWLSANAPTP